MKNHITYKFIILILLFQSSNAQQLLEQSKISLALNKDLEITCYKAFSLTDTNNENYYYLPANLHFSMNESGDKSYSLLLYKNKNKQIEGGIMHWLLTWGLTKRQRERAASLLKAKVGKEAKFMGAVLAEKEVSRDDFEIVGTNKLSQILNTSIVNKGSNPLIPNSKIAVAFKFTKDAAKEISDLFHNSNEKRAIEIIMRFKVPFKELNRKTAKKTIILKQNLQTLITN